MLNKVVKTGSKNSLTSYTINKAKKMFKTEKHAYQSAFLAQSRQAFLPYLQRGNEGKSKIISIYDL